MSRLLKLLMIGGCIWLFTLAICFIKHLWFLFEAINSYSKYYITHLIALSTCRFLANAADPMFSFSVVR